MRWGAALAILGALAAMPALAGLGRAQAPTLAEQRDRLENARHQSEAARARAGALQRAAAAERDAAARARAEEAAAAQRIRAAAADIVAAQARIAIADRLLAAQRARLGERQAPILRLIAALQSLARRPPALGLVQPGSTDDMVHVRAMLATMLPVVQARTADVRAELERARGLKLAAQSAAAAASDGRALLERERVALVHLEARHRLRSRAFDRDALVESDRAIALGEKARAIVDTMETMGEASATQADLEVLPGPLPRPDAEAAPAEASAPADRPPPYRLPVAGRIVTGLGALSPSGVRSRGITLATAPGAPAVAPAGGTVIYAGAFRDYGAIVILDHGKGWTSLVTGLGTLAVHRGQQVAPGATLGRTPEAESPRVTVELRRRGTPMDLTALLGRG